MLTVDMSEFQEALLKKQRELLAGEGLKPIGSMMGNSRQGDMADQADGINEVHIALKLRSTDAKIMQAIEEALERIDRGTYGICKDCGEAISAARLRAIPWTRSCISCKEKQK